MDTDDLINKGVVLRPGPSARGGAGKTVIVTGVGRGGTSLAASVLFHAGVHMGRYLSEAVYEDREFAHAMHAGDRDLLTHLIASRNASHRTWGLKIPSLHAMIEYQDISLFRNPYLIVMFRDAVAVAERASIAEYRNALATMRETLDAQRNLLGFVHNIAAPALLCSYEKALIDPGNFVDAVMRFCEIPLDDETRQSVLAVIEPNPQNYITVARRRYLGRLEHTVDNVLHGWCWEVGSLEPVELDCFVGTEKILTFKAAEFRSDLLAAKCANGCHGFALDLRAFTLNPERAVTVRVTGREFVLPGSGQKLKDYERSSAKDLSEAGR
jgi:hypothetical protein